MVHDGILFAALSHSHARSMARAHLPDYLSDQRIGTVNDVFSHLLRPGFLICRSLTSLGFANYL